jgi:hypothetical protein
MWKTTGKVGDTTSESIQQNRYYCDICKFFDDDPKKSIYHCDGCGERNYDLDFVDVSQESAG